jgi:hypothetical protein
LERQAIENIEKEGIDQKNLARCNILKYFVEHIDLHDDDDNDDETNQIIVEWEKNHCDDRGDDEMDCMDLF